MDQVQQAACKEEEPSADVAVDHQVEAMREQAMAGRRAVHAVDVLVVAVTRAATWARAVERQAVAMVLFSCRRHSVHRRSIGRMAICPPTYSWRTPPTAMAALQTTSSSVPRSRSTCWMRCLGGTTRLVDLICQCPSKEAAWKVVMGPRRTRRHTRSIGHLAPSRQSTCTHRSRMGKRQSGRSALAAGRAHSHSLDYASRTSLKEDWSCRRSREAVGLPVVTAAFHHRKRSSASEALCRRSTCTGNNRPASRQSERTPEAW